MSHPYLREELAECQKGFDEAVETIVRLKDENARFRTALEKWATKLEEYVGYSSTVTRIVAEMRTRSASEEP